VTPKVEVVLDSRNAYNDKRLTTLYVEYERFFHQEVLTHRVFSRNSASSRAIPTRRLIELVDDEPVLPSFIGVNCPGMAAAEELSGSEREEFLSDVLKIKEVAVWVADKWGGRVHKQNVNRYLEPFMPIGVVLSGTEWGNFLWLRDDPAAEPHFRRLAHAICEALAGSSPQLLTPGWEWHLPYITRADWNNPLCKLWEPRDFAFVSAARCARASFFRAGDGSDKTITAECDKGVELAQRRHWSPLEHQAVACCEAADYQSGNFFGWGQFRKTFALENYSPVHSPEFYSRRG
jgi:hypothetical protein